MEITKYKDGSMTPEHCELSFLNTELYQEYLELISKLKEQCTHKDVSSLMRLTIVMFDLGFYRPSPP
ncbi:MAG: hypothetical protein ACUVWN_10280 [bacterium]